MKERKFNLQVSSQSQNSAQSQKTSNEGAEDWDTFRHFVRIIQIVGDLIIKYESLEENLSKQIQDDFIHKQKVFANQVESDSDDLLSILSFKEYLLDLDDRAKLNQLISIIQSGNHR